MSDVDDSLSSSSDDEPVEYPQGPSSHSGLSDEEEASKPAAAEVEKRASSSSDSSSSDSSADDAKSERSAPAKKKSDDEAGKESSDDDDDAKSERSVESHKKSDDETTKAHSSDDETKSERSVQPRAKSEEDKMQLSDDDDAKSERSVQIRRKPDDGEKILLSDDDDDAKSERSIPTRRKSVDEDEKILLSDDDDDIVGPRMYQEMEEEVEAPQPPIEYDLPLVRGDYGTLGPILSRLPNFISVDTHPFVEDLYENEGEDVNAVDEEGRSRLQLKVENCIRWRHVLDSDGKPVVDEQGKPKRESNCKITKWSDGSSTLHLGSEVYEINEQEIKEYNQLFLRMRNGLHGNSIFRRRYAFRPLSTDSLTHKKMTMTMAEKSTKQSKVKMIGIVGDDPETGRASLVRKEEEKLRANARKEALSRKQKERQFKSGLSHGFLEDRDEDYDDPDSLSAIKRQFTGRSRFDRFGDIASKYYSSDEAEDDHSRRIERSKIESDDEDEPGSSTKKKKEEKKKKKIVLSDDDED